MIAGDEGEVLHFGIDQVSIAPALMLGADYERALGQVLLAAHFFANAGDHAQIPVHGARIATDDPADRAATWQSQKRDGYQHINR